MKTDRIVIRVTKKQKILLEQVAKNSDMNVSQFVLHRLGICVQNLDSPKMEQTI